MKISNCRFGKTVTDTRMNDLYRRRSYDSGVTTIEVEFEMGTGNRPYFFSMGDFLLIKKCRTAKNVFPQEIADSFVHLFLNQSKRNDDIKSTDPVNNPQHYKSKKGFESIDVIEAFGLCFCLGNVAKYIFRAGKKDPKKEIQDLEKARWYLDRKIQQLKNK